MWIFCCGMQRSGSTLQFQITARLVEETGLGRRVEWVPAEEFPQLRQKYADYPGWKVFKHHLCTGEMAAEFYRHNALGVYSFRDLRDVVVSIMRKYGLSFDQLWDGEFLPQTLFHYHRWTTLPRVLVSKYEDMVADLPGEVARIAAHLGIPCDRPRCERIASEYTLQRQRERIEEAKRLGRLRRGLADVLYDPYTNLHTDHIHAGEIGGWAKTLSVGQVALIEDYARDWLVARGYELAQGSLQRSWHKFWYQQKRKARGFRQRLRRRFLVVGRPS